MPSFFEHSKRKLAQYSLTASLVVGGLLGLVGGAAVYGMGNQYEQALILIVVAVSLMFLLFSFRVYQHEKWELFDMAKKCRETEGKSTEAEVRETLEELLHETRQSRHRLEAEEAKFQRRLERLTRVSDSSEGEETR